MAYYVCTKNYIIAHVFCLPVSSEVKVIRTVYLSLYLDPQLPALSHPRRTEGQRINLHVLLKPTEMNTFLSATYRGVF